MLPLLLSLLALTPDARWKAALADLRAVPAESRHVTRYAELEAVPPEKRQSFIAAFVFAINSTSMGSLPVKPTLIGDDLLRLDTAALGWDRDFRTEELARLEQSGVVFRFGSGSSRERFVDIWEDFGAVEPYYRVPYGVVRGWIDPAAAEEARLLSESAKFLVRADWLLPRLLLEAKDGGFYSQLLLLPTNEKDLYKRFGEDIATVDRFAQLRHGGATVGPSIVAIHNRELQEIPSDYGADLKFIWRTFDFATDADDPAKNIFRSLAGSVVHDGREIIGTLPNGLHWYYLSDGKGAQANVVPQAIALDQRNRRGISNPNVTNAIKCFDCHTSVSGIYPFSDNVRAAVIGRDVALAVIAERGKIKTEFVPVETDVQAGRIVVPGLAPAPAAKVQIKFANYLDDGLRRRVYNRAKDLEEYYLTDLDGRIGRQQASYALHLAACVGLTPLEASEALIGSFNAYHEDLVTQEQAARELGYSVEEAILVLRQSGNQDLVLLARQNPDLLARERTAQPIKRAAWEKGFPDAAKVPVYSWEKLLRQVPVRYPVPSGY